MSRYRWRDRDPFSTITEALFDLTVDELKGLAKSLQNDLPARKADLVHLISDALGEEKLALLWGRLTELERAYLAEVVFSGEASFDEDCFRAKYGKSSPLELPSSLVRIFLPKGQMPIELISRLKSLAGRPEKAKVATLEELPSSVSVEHRWYKVRNNRDTSETEQRPLAIRQTEEESLKDLPLLLQLVDMGKLGVGDANRRPTTGTMKYLSGLLHGGDFYNDTGHEEDQEKVGAIKSFAWPLLLQTAGWCKPFGTKLKLTSKGLKALSEPTPLLVKAAYEAWLGSDLLDEYNRINAVRGQTGNGRRSMTDPTARRDAVVSALHDCPSGHWISVDEFSRFMRAAHDFSVTEEPWDLYLCEKQYGSLGYEGFGTWDILQKRYMLVFLFEYMATLGLIDVAYVRPHEIRMKDCKSMWGTDDLEFFSRYDGLIYFRINLLGNFCLGRMDRYEPARQASGAKHLKVLSNLEIAFHPGILPQGDLLFMERFSDPVSEGVMKLNAAKILDLASQENGIDRIVEFLKIRSENAFPETVERFLRDVGKKSACLSDAGHVRLLKVADAELACLLVNDPVFQKLCLPAGQEHVAVLSGREKAFANAVKKMGYACPAFLEKL